MIYLFTGNSDFLIREKTLAWKKLFIKKNGDFNLIHFQNITEIDNNFLSESILSQWFMWEKKLIIIDDIPLNSVDSKNKTLSAKQDFLSKILSSIPDSNIVIFSSCLPDKRSKFYKLIKKEATKIEEFNSQWESDIYQIIQKKYGNIIESSAINLLIKYKSQNITKIISEINKLLITRKNITVSDIKNYIKPELEESIFQIIDDILNINIPSALTKLHIILQDTSVYAFYNNLLSNIRTSIYISKLKTLKTPINEITSALNLWNRGFLIQKKYKISHNALEKFYTQLVNLDKKMKSWKLLWTEEKDFIFEIEKCILSIET